MIPSHYSIRFESVWQVGSSFHVVWSPVIREILKGIVSSLASDGIQVAALMQNRMSITRVLSAVVDDDDDAVRAAIADASVSL